MNEIKTHKLNFNGKELLFSHSSNDPSGSGCIREIVVNNDYNLDRFEGLDGETLIDIGSNNGLVAIILAIQNPKSKIIAVEPSLELCEIIDINIRQNGINNIELIQKAFSERKDTIEFILSNLCTGASFAGASDEESFKKFSSKAFVDSKLPYKKYNVETISFDDIIRDRSIDKVEFLKIDCEGGEYSLYQSDYFKRGIVNHVSGELHETDWLKSSEGDANRLLRFIRLHAIGQIDMTILNIRNGIVKESKIQNFQ